MIGEKASKQPKYALRARGEVIGEYEDRWLVSISEDGEEIQAKSDVPIEEIPHARRTCPLNAGDIVELDYWAIPRKNKTDIGYEFHFVDRRYYEPTKESVNRNMRIIEAYTGFMLLLGLVCILRVAV